MALEHPVVIEVQTEAGATEQVRVGTARRSGTGFVLELGALRIAAPVEAGRPSPRLTATPPPHGAGVTEELEYIAARARQTLADPSKERWHARERELLQLVEKEIARVRSAT